MENNIADVVFTDMMRHNDDFRVFVPPFIAKMGADVDSEADSQRSRNPKPSRLTTDTTEKTSFDTAASHISSDQRGIAAQPKLALKGLLINLGGLERKVSQRLGRNKSEMMFEDQVEPHRGRKRTRDSGGTALEADGAGREGYRPKEWAVCKLELIYALGLAKVMDILHRRSSRSGCRMASSYKLP